VLCGARPDYGWVSEESSSPVIRPRYWLVDPIDGTSAFLRGRREFSISVTLIEAGRPIVAAVCNPVTDELFDAYAGGGVRLNGKPVQATGQATLDGVNLMISRTEYDRLDWHKQLGDVTVEGHKLDRLQTRPSRRRPHRRYSHGLGQEHLGRRRRRPLGMRSGGTYHRRDGRAIRLHRPAGADKLDGRDGQGVAWSAGGAD
jgi:hypothetical protein